MYSGWGIVARRAEAFIKRLSKTAERRGHPRSLDDHIRETLIEGIFLGSDKTALAHGYVSHKALVSREDVVNGMQRAAASRWYPSQDI